MLLVQLTVSDIIQIISIVASLTTSIVAIVISVKALRQNSRMIEESTRPNIQIYSVYIHSLVYLIIKNFGQSSCTIDSLSCSHKFSTKETFDKLGENAFDKVRGALIAPGGAIRFPLISHQTSKELMTFTITYHSSTKTYTDDFCFSLHNNSPFSDTYPGGSKEQDYLKNMSKSLYDLVKLKL